MPEPPPLATPENVGCVCNKEERDNPNCNWRPVCKQLEQKRLEQKPVTDPKQYTSEYELACLLFQCPACNAPAGLGCNDGARGTRHFTRLHDPHTSRVDLLRSLRAYVRGTNV